MNYVTKRERQLLVVLAAQREPIPGRELAGKLNWGYWVVYTIGLALVRRGLASSKDSFDSYGRRRSFTITLAGREAIGLG